MHAYLLKRLRDGVVFIRRQKHVLREVDLYAMSLPNRDVGRDLQEAVHDGGRRLGDRRCRAIGEDLRSRATVDTASLRDLCGAGNHPKSNGSTEDFKIMVVDFIF